LPTADVLTRVNVSIDARKEKQLFDIIIIVVVTIIA